MSVANLRSEISEAARRRMLAVRGEPLFVCDWDRALFIHYETAPSVLQKNIPFELDLYAGRAFVSIVAFTMRGMRPRFGGQLATLLCKPIATHGLLNVRTYVRHNAEPGIYFMSEWLQNRVSVVLGPLIFGLPYRFGRLDYRHAAEIGELRGMVEAREGVLRYRGDLAGSSFDECEPGSLNEFLLERYTAFTAHRGRKSFFRVWHQPWRQLPVNIDVSDDDYLARLVAGGNRQSKFLRIIRREPVFGWAGRIRLIDKTARKFTRSLAFAQEKSGRGCVLL